MKSIKLVVTCFVLTIILSSCASRKDVVYFQGVDTVAMDSINKNSNYSPILKPDDQLSIIVSSIDGEAALPFNLPAASVNITGLNATGNPQIQAYLIAQDGTIEFPQLGRLHLAGLTRLQAIDLFKTKLAPFLNDPVVTIQIVNFKVSVLGEVKKSGTFPVKNERITVIEALGLAGDTSLWGLRNNVLVIRETENGKQFVRVDLTSPEMFTSPVYYLQQNDVVYVEPNKPKINNSATSATTGIIISITSLAITVISILLR